MYATYVVEAILFEFSMYVKSFFSPKINLSLFFWPILPYSFGTVFDKHYHGRSAAAGVVDGRGGEKRNKEDKSNCFFT